MSEFGYHDVERAALGFVLEDETWPVFLDWVRERHATTASHDWWDGAPDLGEIRREWLRHSPEASIRALAAKS